jgi:ferredoxin
MADPKDRLVENVPGAYYVDSQCIDCDVCRVTAPANFQRSEEKGYSYVFRQPESPEENAQCQEAMDSCPVEAIGSDGSS